MSDDTTPKLQFVRIYIGEQRMDVGLHDPVSGRRRLIRYKWDTRNSVSVPPARWFEAVLGEVQYQRSQELKKKTGRYIPRG